MALVYALIAKSNPTEMRYIGKTASASPKGRHYSHIREAKISEEQTYKLNWIRKVISQNDEVLVITLEDNLTEKQSFQREEYLIAYYRAYGDRLTNATLGGEGISGHHFKLSEETRTNMRLAQASRSEEHQARLTASLARYLASEEGKANIRALAEARTGYKQSPEWAEKSKNAALGYKHTEEDKVKISDANRKRVRSEESKNKTRLSMLAFHANKVKDNQTSDGTST